MRKLKLLIWKLYLQLSQFLLVPIWFDGFLIYQVNNISSKVLRVEDRKSSIDLRVCVMISSLFFTAEFFRSVISVSILVITHSMAWRPWNYEKKKLNWVSWLFPSITKGWVKKIKYIILSADNVLKTVNSSMLLIHKFRGKEVKDSKDKFWLKWYIYNDLILYDFLLEIWYLNKYGMVRL